MKIITLLREVKIPENMHGWMFDRAMKQFLKRGHKYSLQKALASVYLLGMLDAQDSVRRHGVEHLGEYRDPTDVVWFDLD